MAFGSYASLVDNFDRANENPIAGNWVGTGVDSDDNNCQINGNVFQAANTSPACSAYYNAQTWGPEAEVFYTINTKPASVNYQRIYAAVSDPGTATPDGYMCQIEDQAGTDIVRLFRMDNGAFTQIGSTWTAEFSAGYRYGIEVLAGSVKVYRDTGTGWVDGISSTDTTYRPVAGYYGLGASTSTNGGTLNDFYVGNIVVAPPGWKRVYGPAALSSSAATLYTVPSNRRFILRHIHAYNPGGSTVNLTLSVGADAAATRVYDAYPVAADVPLDNRRKYVLTEGETIQGYGSIASQLVLVLQGEELEAA